MEYNDYAGIIAARISDLRKRAGMTQEALAEKLGVTFQAVSKWERAVSCPDINFLPVLAEIFGVSIDYLFSEPADCNDAQEVIPDSKVDDEENDETAETDRDDKNEQTEYVEFKECTMKRPWYKNIFEKYSYHIENQYIPQDDGKLRVLLFRGSNLMKEYDGKSKDIIFKYDGEALDVISMLSVECKNGINGNVEAGNDVTVTGTVEGDVDAGNSVTCADINGDVDTGGGVTANDIYGDVDAGGSVYIAGRLMEM